MLHGYTLIAVIYIIFVSLYFIASSGHVSTMPLLYRKKKNVPHFLIFLMMLSRHTRTSTLRQHGTHGFHFLSFLIYLESLPIDIYLLFSTIYWHFQVFPSPLAWRHAFRRRRQPSGAAMIDISSDRVLGWFWAPAIFEMRIFHYALIGWFSAQKGFAAWFRFARIYFSMAFRSSSVSFRQPYFPHAAVTSQKCLYFSL